MLDFHLYSGVVYIDLVRIKREFQYWNIGRSIQLRGPVLGNELEFCRSGNPDERPRMQMISRVVTLGDARAVQIRE